MVLRWLVLEVVWSLEGYSFSFSFLHLILFSFFVLFYFHFTSYSVFVICPRSFSRFLLYSLYFFFCLLQVTTSPTFVRRKQSLNNVIFLHMSKYLMEISIYSLEITFQGIYFATLFLIPSWKNLLVKPLIRCAHFGIKSSFLFVKLKLFPCNIQKHGMTKGKHGHFQYFEILWPNKLFILPVEHRSWNTYNIEPFWFFFCYPQVLETGCKPVLLYFSSTSVNFHFQFSTILIAHL